MTHIIKLTRSDSLLSITVYDPKLAELVSESFGDLESLNFFVQTVAKKHRMESAIIVEHRTDNNSVKLWRGEDADSIFFS